MPSVDELLGPKPAVDTLLGPKPAAQPKSIDQSKFSVPFSGTNRRIHNAPQDTRPETVGQAMSRTWQEERPTGLPEVYKRDTGVLGVPTDLALKAAQGLQAGYDAAAAGIGAATGHPELGHDIQALPEAFLGSMGGAAPGEVAATRAGKPALRPLSELGTVVRTGAEVSKPVGNAERAAYTVRAILNPTSLGVGAKRTESTLRGAYGQAARDTTQTEQEFEQYARQVAGMDPLTQRQFYSHVEGRGAGTPVSDPALQPVADTLRDAFQERRAKLEGLARTADMSFVEDYFPHMWKDVGKAQEFARNWTSKQGSTGPLKKRTLPTIEDGLNAGLELAEPNPLKAASRYVNSMDRFIASQEALETARKAGDVKYYRVGGKNVPVGWEPIIGRSARKSTPAGEMQAYAPHDAAQVYNNFFDPGAQGAYGDVVRAARRLSNDVTKLKLGFSLYHGTTMTGEAMMSDVATGIKQLARGQAKGLVTIAKAPAAPITRTILGSRLKKQYFGEKNYGPEMEAIADGFAQAGGRFKMDPLFRNGATSGFFKAFRRGELAGDLKAMGQDMKLHPARGGARTFGKIVSRAASDIAAPLFEKYIPALKGGAYMSLMKDYVEAHPYATAAEIRAYSIKAVDSIDNRFGEMSQDNLFWNQKLKEVLPIIVRAPTWDIGTVREIGGGLTDIPKSAKAMLEGKDISDRTAYVVALAITTAAINGAYTYLKTGTMPQGRDFAAGRTGGTDVRSGAPERIMAPGYFKDVVGATEHPLQLIKDKRSDLLSTLTDALANEDYAGHKIANSEVDGYAKAALDWGAFVAKGLGMPFTIEQGGKGKAVGSNLSSVERFIGVRPAPLGLTDPAKVEQIEHRQALKAAKTKQTSEAFQRRNYPDSQ